MHSLVVGKNVYLRHPCLEDEEEFVGLRRCSTSLHRPWEPDPPPGVDPFSHDVFVRFIGQSNSARSQKHLVCRIVDDRICGYIGLNEIVMAAFCSAYAGYWTGLPFVRKGYAREALQLCIVRAFSQLDLHRVEANIIPTNVASLAVAKGAGMRKEGYSPRYLRIAGRWQDHERWAITREDWKALQRD